MKWPWTKIHDRLTTIEEHLADLSIKMNTLTAENYKLRKYLDAAVPGIGRIIARLDPLFGISELDPVRRAESDKIAQDVITKLQAEAEISRRYNP